MPVFLSNQDFTHRPEEARRAADKAVVFITDEGEPTHVLMSMNAYRKLRGEGRSLVERMWFEGCEGIADIELPLERSTERPRDVDFD